MTVEVHGNELRMYPVAAGSTSVVVTARNGSGSATHTVSVTVLPARPEAVGTLDSIPLTVGGSPAEVDVAAAFTGAGLTITAQTGNAQVATATVSGTVVTVTPVGAGNTTLTVTAENEGGQARQRAQVSVVTSGAPRAVGTLAAVSLSAGGSAGEVDVADAFTGSGLTIKARAGDTQVATVTVAGTVVTITPVGAGNTVVSVTAENANGSAQQRVTVTVAASPPSAVGTLAPVSLSASGSAVTVDVASAFAPGGFTVEAESGDTGVVTVGVSGTVVTITPVSAGSTSVEVTARAAGGSATQSISVTVVGGAPQAVGTVSPLTLKLRPGTGIYSYIEFASRFTPAGFTLEAQSGNPGIVTVEVHRTEVRFYAVGAGDTSVVVTARNGSGSATHTVSVTVVSEAPEAMGTLDPVSLTVGGVSAHVNVSGAFTGTGLTFEAETRDTQVATASANGIFVTLAPVAAGSTSVVVTASNASGSATQTMNVTVTNPAAPTTIGSAPGTTNLKVGDGAVSFDMVDFFAAEDEHSVTLDVRSGNEAVVTVEVDRFSFPNSPLDSIVNIRPVGVGETNVVATVSNASGSVSKTFPVVVTAAQGFGVVGGSTPIGAQGAQGAPVFRPASRP